MFVMTAKISKTKLAAAAVVLVAVVLVVVLLVTGSGGKKASLADAPAGATNDERVAYLATFGWSVNAEPKEVQKIRIPESSDNKVFARYNELQRSQGFDLTGFGGKEAMRYVYEILNYRAGLERRRHHLCRHIPLHRHHRRRHYQLRTGGKDPRLQDARHGPGNEQRVRPGIQFRRIRRKHGAL